MCAATATLAGCGGSHTPLGAPGAPSASRLSGKPVTFPAAGAGCYLKIDGDKHIIVRQVDKLSAFYCCVSNCEPASGAK